MKTKWGDIIELKVVHFKKIFLGVTETFIYNQIISMNKVQNYVVCRKKEMTNNFDFSRIADVKEIPHRLSWSVHKYIFALLGICGKYYTLDQGEIAE